MSNEEPDDQQRDGPGEGDGHDRAPEAAESQGAQEKRPGEPTTEPRGNAPLDEQALKQGLDKLDQVGGGS